MQAKKQNRGSASSPRLRFRSIPAFLVTPSGGSRRRAVAVAALLKKSVNFPCFPGLLFDENKTYAIIHQIENAIFGNQMKWPNQ